MLRPATCAAPNQANPLEKLPDEILQKILNFAMLRPSPFYIDWDRDSEKTQQGTIAFSGSAACSITMTIDYPHSSTTTRLIRCLPDSQAIHCADWLRINTTSRRIRRLGKEAYFANKIVAINTRRTSSDSKFFGKEDNLLLRQRVRHVIFANLNFQSPAELMSMPRRVAVFERLQHFTLFYGFRLGDQLECLTTPMSHRVGQEGAQSGVTEVPPTLKDLLRRIGVPSELNMDIMVACGTTWEFYRSSLAQHVYPMLRFKAEVLEQTKSLS
ncbi:hypothetical protein JX265_013115 [Neoarthrinium moseri]|uniref:Uncharacterized protein n=1 Tax=Neoarthrinium moseri TaxID=1658444 RepID=A0A9P9W970_9PEZI|nr:hypothetical protein JX266_005061 [Neoarthrinium moseri]KAI1852144.1 hypothetical protein JX265_013115 [Neoarthrinium moseri]